MAKKTKKGEYDWSPAEKWMTENPSETFVAFKKAFPKYPFTDATYYSHKCIFLKLEKKQGCNRRTLYETIGVMDEEEVNKLHGIDAMRKLLEIINKRGKTNIEIIRLADPDVVEFRTFTR